MNLSAEARYTFSSPPEDKNQECLNTIANACGLLAVLALLGTISCIVPGPCLGEKCRRWGVKIMKTFFSTWIVFWDALPVRNTTPEDRPGPKRKVVSKLPIFRASRCTAENWLGYPDAESLMRLEQVGETKLPNVVGGEFPWLNLSFKMEQIWHRCIYIYIYYICMCIYIYICIRIHYIIYHYIHTHNIPIIIQLPLILCVSMHVSFQVKKKSLGDRWWCLEGT